MGNSFPPIQNQGFFDQPGVGWNGSPAQGPWGPTENSSDPNSYYQSSTNWYGNPYAMQYANWYNSQYGQPTQQQQQQIQNQGQGFSNDYQTYKTAADVSYGVNPATGIANGIPQNMTYQPNEASDITQYDLRTGSMTTPDAYQQMQWNPDEQAAYSGDPYAGYNAFAGAVQGGYNDMDSQRGLTYDALAEQDTNLRSLGEGYQKTAGGILDTAGTGERGAAYASDLNLDPNYAGQITGQLGANASAARGIYQDPNLQVSNDYMTNEQFGPQDAQDLEALAGTAVGARYRGQIEDVKRQAAAQGTTSPMAIAAMEDRFGRQSAQEAADAAIQGRTQGKQMELQTTQNRENTRLGAEQTQAGMGLGAELTLGGQALQAESETEQMRLGAAEKARQMQVQAESDLAAKGLASASDVAGFQAGNERAQSAARLGAYNSMGQQQQALDMFNTQGQTQTQTAGEAAASDRAATTAAQRVAAARANSTQQFGQGQTVAGSLSTAGQTIADRRLAAGQEQRGYMTGMVGANQQGMLTNTGQAQNFINGQNSAGNAAAGTYAGYDTNRRNTAAGAKNPSPFGAVVGAGLGALAGLP